MYIYLHACVCVHACKHKYINMFCLFECICGFKTNHGTIYKGAHSWEKFILILLGSH